MIASAAITTATMMMIPMLMAAIIRPPLATISLRLACAKPRQGAGLELFTERLRDLTAKTYPRRTPDRLRGGPGAPGRARGDAPRRGRPTQGSCRTDGNPSFWATGVAKTGPVFKLSVVTVGLAAGFGMILFPNRSSACFGVLVFAKTRRPRRLRGADGVMNTRIANRISGVLGMLARLWATV
jgi:hypothetical protein